MCERSSSPPRRATNLPDYYRDALAGCWRGTVRARLRSVRGLGVMAPTRPRQPLGIGGLGASAAWPNYRSRHSLRQARSTFRPTRPSALALRRCAWKQSDALLHSAVDLAEHDVERAEHAGHVGKEMAPAQPIHRLEMGKAG